MQAPNAFPSPVGRARVRAISEEPPSPLILSLQRRARRLGSRETNYNIESLRYVKGG
jgi:hypothetical protein